MKKIWILTLLIALMGCEEDPYEEILSFQSCFVDQKDESEFEFESTPPRFGRGLISLRTNVFSITDGNWNDPSIWSNNSVPSASDNITISHNVIYTNNGSNNNYDHSGNIEIDSDGHLTMNTSTSVSGNPFRIIGTSTNNAQLIVDGQLTTNEDFVLDNVDATFGINSIVYVGDDFRVRGNTNVNLNGFCGAFAVGDDIYINGTNAQLNGLSILVGQDPITATVTTPNTTLANHIDSSNGAQLSQLNLILVSTECTTTPVELVDFHAKWDGERSIDITWSTASEVNSSHFNVLLVEPCQSSSDDKFKAYTVETGEDSSQFKEYKTSLELDFGGYYYLQLEQVDLDGTKSYSEFIAVKVGE